MTGGVFISYRREDSAGFAGRLRDRLIQKFSANQVFMDVDNIEPGLDFTEVLGARVAECDVLLAIIGRNWATCLDERGNKRLDDPNDFVRIEIEAALGREVRVIPTLVDGAAMPRAEDLPDALKPLGRRHAVEISHTRFDMDAERLVRALTQIEEGRKQREAEEAARFAVEAQSAKRREAEEAARQAQADEERRTAEAKARRESQKGPRPAKTVAASIALLLVAATIFAFVLRNGGTEDVREQASLTPATAPSAAGAQSEVPPANAAFSNSDPRVRKCDEVASNPWDMHRPPEVAGVPYGKIDVKTAIAACEAAVQAFPDQPRLQFQTGRALVKSGAYADALKFFTLSAEQNYAPAENSLGAMAYLGSGMPKDAAKAVGWYIKAADQGYAEAQNNLGWSYEHGEGVQANLPQAIVWYKNAAAQGHEQAKANLKRLGVE